MNASLPPLAALRAFEAAARLQSVSRAAQELHVTHGAVSRHVRSLEQALGTALFARQGRGLMLTAAGVRLRDATGEGFGVIGQAWAALQRPAAGAPLVLGCSGSLLARWVIPRLGLLQQELPDVRLHLSASEQPPGPDLDGLDAALLLDTPPWPGEWQVHALGVEWIGPVLSPQLASTLQIEGSDPAVLGDHALLHTRSRPQAWPEWAQAHGLAPEACASAPNSSTWCICWKPLPLAWGSRLRRSRWSPRTWQPGACWRRGDSPPRMAAGYCAPPSATPIHASNGWPAGWVERWRQTSTPLRP
ncbi:transcriptional regulator [Xanthomonas citri pv. mangiferaeindicae]|nr:transcriptional regulator [Xanthomonas citri pv. mangiferaeindicae]